MTQNGSHPKDWTSAQVIAAVNAKGFSMQGLSEEFGLSKPALGRALRSPAYTRHEIRIAKFLGLLPEQIWPERWAKRQARAELKAIAKLLVTEIKNTQAA